MKRLLTPCLLIIFSVGMTQAALADSFGPFDSSASLSSNLELLFADDEFTGGLPSVVLNQTLYFKTLFASDAVVSAGATLTAGADKAYAADLASNWGLLSYDGYYNIGQLTIDYNGETYNLTDLVSGLALYYGSSLVYTPEADYRPLVIEGGTLLLAISLPGSGNAVDAVLALSTAPQNFAHAPAPAALMLFGTGLAGIFAARRRSHK